jgi:hypothetical protein
MPDCFTPPNGTSAVEINPGVHPHHPRLDRLGHAEDAPDVAAVEIRRVTDRRIEASL